MVDNIIALMTYFCMLSVAAERAVEIMKVGFLVKFKTPPVTYQLLAGFIGGTLAYSSPPPSTFVQMSPWISIIATGLAVSGGSAFWNSSLAAVSSLAKDMKQTPVTVVVESVK